MAWHHTSLYSDRPSSRNDSMVEELAEQAHRDSIIDELAVQAHRDTRSSSPHSSDSNSSPMSITSRASFLDELHERPDSIAEGFSSSSGDSSSTMGDLDELHEYVDPDMTILSSSPPRSVTSADSFLCEMHESREAALQEVVEQRRQAISPTLSDMLNRFYVFGEANQLGSRWYCLSSCRRRAECGHTVPGLNPPGL
jgi:hypothetical protein